MADNATVDEAEGRAGEGNPRVPARLRMPLRNLDEVQRELSRLYRDMRGGVIETQDGSRMANVLSILGRLMEGSELEVRMKALEDVARKRGEQF